jgi:hypothetical protein
MATPKEKAKAAAKKRQEKRGKQSMKNATKAVKAKKGKPVKKKTESDAAKKKRIITQNHFHKLAAEAREASRDKPFDLKMVNKAKAKVKAKAEARKKKGKK